MRTRVAQMIRALLLRCDAGEPPGTRLYAPRALAWLAAARLPPDADRALRRLERLYRAIHVDALAADAEVRRRAAADPIAVALSELVGIGPVMGLTIRAEIGDIARFTRGPALCASLESLAHDVAASSLIRRSTWLFVRWLSYPNVLPAHTCPARALRTVASEAVRGIIPGRPSAVDAADVLRDRATV